MILIMGVTASGKGNLAFELARRLDGEILSVDSMKVYRRMDIGTAKPSRAARDTVTHHLIDVVEPSESFSMGRYLPLAHQAIAQIQHRNRPIIAVGGTAMYIRALLEGVFEGPPADAQLRDKLKRRASRSGSPSLHRQLAQIDPAAAQKIHPNDLKRIIRALEVYELTGKPISTLQRQFRTGNYRFQWRLIGLRSQKDHANRRINQRVNNMIDQGLVAEVNSLLAEPAGLSPQAAQALGYAEIIQYLRGQLTLQEAVEKIKINTRRFAKSQRTWFRTFHDLYWVDLQPDQTTTQLADRVMKHLQI